MHEPHPLRWKSMIGLGLVLALVGLFLLLFPGPATGLFGFIVGIVILVLAALILVEGLFLEKEGMYRWGVVILGILSLLLGLFTIIDPSRPVVATGLLFGLFIILFGLVEIVVACSLIEGMMVRLVLGMMGIVALILGAVIALNPLAGIQTITVLAGIYLVVLGMMRIAHGLNERHEEQKITVKLL